MGGSLSSGLGSFHLNSCSMQLRVFEAIPENYRFKILRQKKSHDLKPRLKREEKKRLRNAFCKNVQASAFEALIRNGCFFLHKVSTTRFKHETTSSGICDPTFDTTGFY